MNTIDITIEESGNFEFFDVGCTTDHGFYILLMLGIIESWKECANCQDCWINSTNHNQILVEAKKIAKKFGLEENFIKFQNVYSEIYMLEIREKIYQIRSNRYYNDLSIGIRCILAALSPKLSYHIISGVIIFPNTMKEHFLNVLSAGLNVVFNIRDFMGEEKYIESCRMVCPIITMIKKDKQYYLRYFNQFHSHFDKKLILQGLTDFLITDLNPN
ncbi:hypothetical protein SteCoe_25943 [Stentor coeruleus]|uniref:Uncharacterized protein n=1 Tax=Stentor coeruleus TaxID=5963 RepID=A0A1R2BEF5_9CILI|nr:hypothetical protein SteCoe_25943 [Stentor coeruleus]